MPKFLNTEGNASLAIGVCDRCNRKFPIGCLRPDPNAPGLRVCEEDLDIFDPWRLPARQTEDITVHYPRPDVPLGRFDPLMMDGSFSMDGTEIMEGVH